jgi:multiple sugar transport system substrate-binding protein/putative aldouronate transport system substrate-binding protein
MKKLLAWVLTLAMVLSMGIFSTVAMADDPIVITFYDEAANYHGTQTGWFAKVVKDRFNIELNIIAPQVIGGEVYATRAVDGDLGDIIIVDKSKMKTLVEEGLVKDISDTLPACENIMRFKDQIDTYNKELTGEEGKYYGIPAEMTDTSPTELTDDVIYSSPQLRWDLYTQIGRPEIKNLDDLVDVLAQIHEIHPTEGGENAYPLSLWPDWDGNDNMIGIANVVQLTTWYGEKIKGSAILKPDNTFGKITDRENAYYKITKFLNKAYQRGLVDPESGTQKWDNVAAKLSARRVDLMWYSWQQGFTNSSEFASQGATFIYIPVGDQHYYADADRYYGADRMWAVGSKVEGDKYELVMKFLDWYASPEGMTFQHVGLEGLNYTVNEDGTFTKLHDDALALNLEVPAEYGGEVFHLEASRHENSIGRGVRWATKRHGAKRKMSEVNIDSVW